MTTYTTRQDDVLDDVIFRYYGFTDGVVETVMETNRALNLGQYGPQLPAGLVLVMPDVDPPVESSQPTRLWE